MTIGSACPTTARGLRDKVVRTGAPLAAHRPAASPSPVSVDLEVGVTAGVGQTGGRAP